MVVVGAGFSGIGAAIRLRRHGVRDLLVLEKAPQLGGTWRENTYPGCACDVPSPLYSYSFAPNPGWSRTFAGQQEIHDYLRATADRYGVGEVLRCGVRVLRARWDPSARRWCLETTDGEYSAKALVLATGPWHEPRRPDVPGLDAFGGPVFHTAEWDHAVDLSGRRVAVVGSGASAVQVVPAIQARTAAVHLFQRTAQWLLPRPDLPVSPALKWCLSHVPGAQRAIRAGQYGLQEGFGHAFRHPRLVGPVQAASRAYLRLAVRDRVLRRALTPGYRLGCKRLLTSSTYYPALAEPHVHLHPTAVSAVRGNRVIGADGTEAEADVLILATGFRVGELPLARSVHGTDGRTLHETWGEDGPQAYLGTSVSGFPNLFLLLGPNLLSGSSSAITVLEAQLAYLCSALAHLRLGSHTSMDVRPAVQAAYNAAVQEALRTTVYNTGGCSSYYFGPGGRNTFCWPWSTGRLVRRLNHFRAADYTYRASSGPAPAPRAPADHGRTADAEGITA
ncbi:NAD(P)/FAD-dependent oxidoreductase [Streptomyces sp. ISL-11]|uniref:flavin-containing monooxygenase n=1 Tax=Streptomyces sp. ISL-11 TaxID=2819174 RepID=UPI001BE87FAB|nr:NAD(P)/FAD-dependent oxidoreductase [Streptomyces sp. ISL-11]MBT2382436.1 NAD(P)/FAD-dependent oxidoreductase [Streptomyces sp. ISL-11]